MGSVRPIHRYIRQKRFEYTLYQLLGYRGYVPRELVDLLEETGYDKRPRYIWESIRAFIKKHKFGNVYYNRIPTIIQMLNLNLQINIQDNSRFITDIIDEFKVISYVRRYAPPPKSYNLFAYSRPLDDYVIDAPRAYIFSLRSNTNAHRYQA